MTNGLAIEAARRARKRPGPKPKGSKPAAWEPVYGVPAPTVRERNEEGIADLLMRMAVGECYDINRSRPPLYELCRTIRRVYDVDHTKMKWILRPSGRPKWTRVWRVR
jgi:hypothetical protein